MSRPKGPEGPAAWEAVESAIRSRASIRAFRSDPVDRATVERLLETAARAPSANNHQPWHVYAFAGETKARISEEILAARHSGEEGHEAEYVYAMKQWREPYKTRRREVGWALYDLMGVVKGDYEGSRAAADRNYVFFDAPVGMILTIERDLSVGSWMDLGMFLQSLMVAARGMGLDTCPQEAFSPYHKILRPLLGIPEEQIVVCGLALGHADESAPANELYTRREPLETFATLRDI